MISFIGLNILKWVAGTRGNQTAVSLPPVASVVSGLSMFIAETDPKEEPKAPAAEGPKLLSLAEAKAARLSDQELERLAKNEICFLLNSPFGQIDFVRAGKKGGKLLLLLPGTPGQSYDFHKLVPLLVEKGFDVLVVTPPGKGHSTASEKFDFSKGLDAYAEFFDWFMAAFELQEVTPVVFSTGFAEMSHAIATREGVLPRIQQWIAISGWGPLWRPEKFAESADKTFTNPIFGPQAYSLSRSSGILRSFVKGVFYRLKDKPELEPLVDEYLKGLPDVLAPDEKSPEVIKKVNDRISWYCKTTKVQYDVNDTAESYYKQHEENRRRFNKLLFMLIAGDHDDVLHTFNEQFGLPAQERVFGDYTKNSELPEGSNQMKRYENAGHMIPYEWAEKLAQDIDQFINLNQQP